MLKMGGTDYGVGCSFDRLLLLKTPDYIGHSLEGKGNQELGVGLALLGHQKPLP